MNINRKLLTVLITLILLTPSLQAENAAVLSDILKPSAIFTDNSQLYVADGVQVFIYSLKDFSLKGKFGKEGEGPREFKVRRFGNSGLFLDVQSDKIMVTSQNKVSFFSKSGDYVSEMKTASGFGGGSLYQPIGNKFAGLGFARADKESFQVVNLFDKKLTKIKEVNRQKSAFRRGKNFNAMITRPSFQTDISCNHIVVDQGNGTLQVLDTEGKEKFTITPAVEPIKFTEEHKKDVLNFYQNDPSFKQFWEFVKNRIDFPSELPLIRGYVAADSKIYVYTFHQKGDSVQYLVYDKTGKLIKTTFVPFVQQSIRATPILSIKKDKLYFLVENEDDEEWELHINPIK